MLRESYIPLKFDEKLLDVFECIGRQLGETFWKLPNGTVVTGETLTEITSQLSESYANEMKEIYNEKHI
jgi:hypothetical protein